MYVCLCRGVSDRAVLEAIRRGAATVDDVGRLTGAGTVCGGCRSAIEGLLRSEGAAGPSHGGDARAGPARRGRGQPVP
ncbi:MAG TPA: (2Fe-2S)-binding protein [Actinomycetota bacterium]|nr:(2Fe-2S)-binding protein [Actinomycetota bacterium]